MLKPSVCVSVCRGEGGCCVCQLDGGDAKDEKKKCAPLLSLLHRPTLRQLTFFSLLSSSRSQTTVWGMRAPSFSLSPGGGVRGYRYTHRGFSFNHHQTRRAPCLKPGELGFSPATTLFADGGYSTACCWWWSAFSCSSRGRLVPKKDAPCGLMTRHSLNTTPTRLSPVTQLPSARYLFFLVLRVQTGQEPVVCAGGLTPSLSFFLFKKN